MRDYINIVETASASPLMRMPKTLAILNSMVASGVIETYAIAGAVAAFYYLEPNVTEDLDVLVMLNSKNGLVDINPIYAFLKNLGYDDFKKEGIVVEGWPVQFLPVANALDAACLRDATSVAVAGVQTRIITAEHLVLKALSVGRLKDKMRVQQFLDAPGVVNLKKLCSMISKYGLMANWKKFLETAEREDPCQP